MSVVLADHRYGKSRVRLVKVERSGSRHDLRDLTLDIQLSGDFAAAYTHGDNRHVLPTDTMKNTVYVLARQQRLGEIEEFGQRVAGHFLTRNQQVSEARVAVSEGTWSRIRVSGKEHDHAFVEAGGGRSTALICHNRSGVTCQAGVADLVVLKTAGSRFEDFLRDEYTTLKDAPERLLGTAIRAEWTYADGNHDYRLVRRAARETMLEVFATHQSSSVQQTLIPIYSVSGYKRDSYIDF